MITKSKNKSMTAEAARTKEIKQSFFFSGELKYNPQTIVAASYEKALEEWQKTRKRIK